MKKKKISHLNYRRHPLKQLDELRVAVVGHPALLPKVVVVRGYELAKVHGRLGTDFQQLNHLFGQRLGRGQGVAVGRVEQRVAGCNTIYSLNQSSFSFSEKLRHLLTIVNVTPRRTRSRGVFALLRQPDDLYPIDIILDLNALHAAQQVLQTDSIVIGRHDDVQTRLDAVQDGCHWDPIRVGLHQPVDDVLHLANCEKDIRQRFQFLFRPSFVILPAKVAGAVGDTVLEVRVKRTIFDLGQERLVQVDVLLLVFVRSNVTNIDHFIKLKNTNRGLEPRLEELTELVQWECVKRHVLGRQIRGKLQKIARKSM